MDAEVHAIDPDELIRTAMFVARQYAGQISELPVGDPSRRNQPRVPIKLRGWLPELHRREFDVEFEFTKKKNSLFNELKGKSSEGYSPHATLFWFLFRDEQELMAMRWGEWLAEMTHADRLALDELCLTILPTAARGQIESTMPTRLHGPVSRLIVEVAALTRRAAEARSPMALKFQGFARQKAGERRNLLEFLTEAEAGVRKKILERWLRELTPDQAAAFEGVPLPPTERRKKSNRSPKKVVVPEHLKKPLKLLPDYQGILAGRRFTVKSFRKWLQTNHNITLEIAGFDKLRDAMRKAEERARKKDEEDARRTVN